ncbi:hypothetical protein V6R21_03490 [Limibacter armeniacum]|uniref:hypothetical protein n=1 Tax=Limibacter armeniacum TaxID=466084 RepID=UPI002FE5C3B5
MTKKLNSTISIILSILCLLIIIWINIKIANRYLSADGKTQALFGLVGILSFSYKYWFIGLSFGSILTSILGKRKNEGKQFFGISMTLGILSMIIIFTPIWRLMI